MKISTRVILYFLVVAVVTALIVGYFSQRAVRGIGLVAVLQSSEALKRLGEAGRRSRADQSCRTRICKG